MSLWTMNNIWHDWTFCYTYNIITCWFHNENQYQFLKNRNTNLILNTFYIRSKILLHVSSPNLGSHLLWCPFLLLTVCKQLLHFSYKKIININTNQSFIISYKSDYKSMALYKMVCTYFCLRKFSAKSALEDDWPGKPAKYTFFQITKNTSK